MTTQVDWNDGSGDKITLTYAAALGAQTISVSSPAYAGYEARTRIITFATTAGSPTATATLQVTQLGKDITIIIRNDVYSVDNNVAVGYE